MKTGDAAAIDRDAPTRCEPPGHSSPAHYLSEPFPCALDLFVLRRVLAFHRADAGQRAKLCAAPLSADRVRVMLGFAERMAHVAVRKRQRRLVQAGLVALAIVGSRAHTRVLWRTLALLHFSAAELTQQPDLLFREVASHMPAGEVRRLIEGFVCRDSDGRVI